MEESKHATRAFEKYSVQAKEQNIKSEEDLLKEEEDNEDKKKEKVCKLTIILKTLSQSQSDEQRVQDGKTKGSKRHMINDRPLSLINIFKGDVVWCTQY